MADNNNMPIDTIVIIKCEFYITTAHCRIAMRYKSAKEFGRMDEIYA
jgi:hypothetical protein